MPLAGVFVGMSFAWVGNAQAILQSPEVDTLADSADAVYTDYVYAFQASILTILVALVLWGVAALGYLDRPCFWNCPSAVYTIAGTVLFAFVSMSLRECWHVVLGAQLLLVSQRFLASLPPRKSE